VERGRLKASRLGAEGAAEVGEGVAEVGEGLGLRAVGPQEAGEPGAFNLGAVTEEEESEEPVALLGAEAREGPPVHADVHRSKYLDGHRGRCDI
jgi:hypothetical protein